MSDHSIRNLLARFGREGCRLEDFHKGITLYGRSGNLSLLEGLVNVHPETPIEDSEVNRYTLAINTRLSTLRASNGSAQEIALLSRLKYNINPDTWNELEDRFVVPAGGVTEWMKRQIPLKSQLQHLADAYAARAEGPVIFTLRQFYDACFAAMDAESVVSSDVESKRVASAFLKYLAQPKGLVTASRTICPANSQRITIVEYPNASGTHFSQREVGDFPVGQSGYLIPSEAHPQVDNLLVDTPRPVVVDAADTTYVLAGTHDLWRCNTVGQRLRKKDTFVHKYESVSVVHREVPVWLGGYGRGFGVGDSGILDYGGSPSLGVIARQARITQK